MITDRDAPHPPFADRIAAGKELAALLRRYAGRPDVMVLGLPRGGVPVAAAVAAALGAPLDVFTVRKIGMPGHRELAIGAIASGGVRVLNRALIAEANLSAHAVDQVIVEEERELQRRERVYRSGRPPLVVRDRVVILVDDGLATGSTMRAAARALRNLEPSRIVVAVPVASIEACRDLEAEVDEVISARVPKHFIAVGHGYIDFSETSDAEVTELLRAFSGVAASPAR